MTEVLDQKLRQELAYAREAMADEAQVQQVLDRLQAAPPRARTRRSPGRIAAALATATLLAASGATAAGLNVLPWDWPTGPHEPGRTSPTYIVGTGETPQGDAFRLLYTRTDDDYCLGIQFPGEGNARNSAPIQESCGGAPSPQLLRPKETLKVGKIREGVRRVRLFPADGGDPVEAQVFDGPPEVDSDFYLAAFPPGTEPGRIETTR